MAALAGIYFLDFPWLCPPILLGAVCTCDTSHFTMKIMIDNKKYKKDAVDSAEEFQTI